MYVIDLECCALSELHGLAEYSNMKEALCDLLGNQGDTEYIRSGVIFTGATSKRATKARYAERFKTYIEASGLGTVSVSMPIKNKNTKNYVTVYVWAVNEKALFKWWENHCSD